MTGELTESASSRTIEAQAAWLREQLWDILLDEVSGQVINTIFQQAGSALEDTLEEEAKDPTKNRSPQARGSTAHGKLKQRLLTRLEEVNRFLARADAELDVEVFMDEYGDRVPQRDKRPRGSIGIDIAIYKPKIDRRHPLLLIDLKTGRGYSNRERNKIIQRFGSKGTMIEIFVNVKK